MNKKIISIISGFLISGLLLTGCAASKADSVKMMEVTPTLTSIQQINSFNPKVASEQALEVVSNNPYDQDFFERVFARLVEQCDNSKSHDNAGIIWDNFVDPLKESGKVPPDLAKTVWNYHFSRQFVSLPSTSGVTNYCQQLSDIKLNLEKEYKMKKVGFNISEQGVPDTHFLNAMYVYNTMWAACDRNN